MTYGHYGGIAETFGGTSRHQSPRGPAPRRVPIDRLAPYLTPRARGRGGSSPRERGESSERAATVCTASPSRTRTTNTSTSLPPEQSPPVCLQVDFVDGRLDHSQSRAKWGRDS